ncbi:trophoblast glycoprotein [Austrofundulus limnaeus]|uniref:Trophoblast glycoprotein n=1 Tax=Austrofundulus limnaeus TaxID=52670 RepID=A0A2I4BBQ2_AUSLI|nr:PREDICTED: trophoblast glycoprotein-like [Austrofundulus limnaeus]
MRLLRSLWSGSDHREDPGRLHKSGTMHFLFLLAVVVPSYLSCPDRCLCSSQTVKCQNQDLDSIPQSIPANTKLLFITGNNISHISEDSFPALDLLTELYLSGNQMESVDAKAFQNLPKLTRLDLSNNRIQNFSETAFPEGSKLQVLNLSRSLYNHNFTDELLSFLRSSNLSQLRSLDLSNNDVVSLPDGIFTALSKLISLNLRNSSLLTVQTGVLWNSSLLQDLDLRDNRLKDLPVATLLDFSLIPDLRIQLVGNPWRCTCFSEDLLRWLKNSTQVVDVQNLTCMAPETLKGRALLQVEQSQLKCPGDLDSVLETSYVFLGLVLALIGLIFLLVLYLNRKGIKRWIYNIRDACRDHMEGYQYRYEINSDPRLANLSINSDV